MQGIFQGLCPKDLFHTLPGKIRITGIFFPQACDLPAQFVQRGHGIAPAVLVAADDRIGDAIVVEIVHIQLHRFFHRSFEDRVQSQVPADQVRIAVPVDICHTQAVPPARRTVQTCLCGPIPENGLFVAEQAYLHPFPGHHQIGIPVPVIVQPPGIGHHAGILQRRGTAGSHIPEPAMTVIFEEILSGGKAISSGHRPVPHEQVKIAVAVEITGPDAGAVAGQVRQGSFFGRPEGSPSIVDQQPVGQKRISLRRHSSSPDNIQVLVAVAVRIEKNRIHIFPETVTHQYRYLRSFKGLVAVLNEQDGCLSGSASQKNILPSVTVHIPHRQGRSFGGHAVGKQGLPAEVVGRVFPVPENQPRDPGLLKQPPPGNFLCSLTPLRGGILNIQGDLAVGLHLFQYLHREIGPAYLQGVDERIFPKAEMQDIFGGGHKAPGSKLLSHLLPPTDEQGHTGARAPWVQATPPEGHGKIMPLPSCRNIVPVNKSPVVDVIDNKIQVAVTIQIGISSAVGIGRLVKTPCPGHIGKCQIPVIPEEIVDIGMEGHLFIKVFVRQAGCTALWKIPVAAGQELHIIQVVGPAINAVGDKEVFPSVVIHVAEQGRPAPVGRIDAGETAYLTEQSPSQVQLQGIPDKLKIVAVFSFQLEELIIILPARLFPYLFLVRQHIQHDNIGQAVIVDVTDVIPH